MNTLELKELKEVAQHREECGASMTVNPKVVLYLISNLEAAAAINTDAAIAEIKAQGVDEFAASEDAKVEKWLAGDEYANYASKMAEEFSANLRAGRKG